MADYPYYPYSVILDIKDNRYFNGEQEELKIKKLYSKDETSILSQAIKRINDFIVAQSALYNEIKKEGIHLDFS